MASLSDGGSIALGLVLAAVSGVLNGSWNVSFSPTHGFAVGRVAAITNAPNNNTNEQSQNQSATAAATRDMKTTIDLSYHHAWILFQIYAGLINIPICIAWAGGIDRVNYIVQESSATSIALIVIFSILWGVGSVGFGLACKIAGVGLGTNLCMGVIMVLGTFLPLCLDRTIGTATGGVVVAGLVICCSGLVFSVKSLQTRDDDEKEAHIRRRTMHNTTISLSLEKLEEQSPEEQNQDENAKESIENSKEIEKETETGSSSDSPSNQRSTIYKVAVCVIAGLFATQLQFAFVFGQEMVDLAADAERGPGSTPTSGTTAVIWLFAISLGAPVSIVYGLYSSPPHIPLSCMWKCPLHRHVLILLTTAVPWVTHIHLYGYANTLLPSEISASVAWPIVMMMTVVAGIVWSIALGEWSEASALAKKYLYLGLIVVTAGIGIIMASVAVA